MSKANSTKSIIYAALVAVAGIVAGGLIEVAGQAEQAAADKSTDAVFEVGGTVYSVCSACHQAYPPADAPEDMGNAAG